MLLFEDNYFEEYIIHKFYNVAYKKLKGSLILKNNIKEESSGFETLIRDDYVEFIGNHIKEEYNWCNFVGIRGSRDKSLKKVYIELDLNLTPKRERIDPELENHIISTKRMLKSTFENIIILGQPGAGKTTTIKKIFKDFVEQKTSLNQFSFPFLIHLRELNNYINRLVFEDKGNVKEGAFKKSAIYRFLLSKLGVSLSSKKNIDDVDLVKHHIAITDFFNELEALIILDGFDEIPDENTKDSLLEILNDFGKKFDKSKYILTSRSADYEYNLINSAEFEISSLDSIQIDKFIKKWFRTIEKAKRFSSDLKSSPYFDTAIRPLNLYNLCSLFDKYGSIPEKPKSIYQKIVYLLLEEWSVQNLVKRKSKYAGFIEERKIDFLSRFAFELTAKFQTSRFTKYQLTSIYNRIYSEFNLPEHGALNVINEIESHNGLIVKSGVYDFEFSHKSLQEYLTAYYLIKLPTLPLSSTMLRLPYEIAVFISISSEASLTFHLIIEKLGVDLFLENFYNRFFSRLILEKPDFRNEVLFSALIWKLKNEISKFVPENQSSKAKKMLLSLDKLVSVSNFRGSLQSFEQFYSIEECFEKDNIRHKESILHLTSRKNRFYVFKVREDGVYVISSIMIELPKKLIVSESDYLTNLI